MNVGKSSGTLCNGSLLALVALGVGLLAACKPAAKPDAGPYSALGETAADITAELLPNKGSIVLLVSEGDQKPVTGTGRTVAAFQARLKTLGLPVKATEVFPAPDALLSGMEPVSAARFMEAIAKHATADAIVSFVGAPRLDAPQIAQLPNPRPKFVAAVTFNPPLRAMFDSGVLHAAIVARAAAQPVSPAASSREQFEASYQLIRAGNAGSPP